MNRIHVTITGEPRSVLQATFALMDSGNSVTSNEPKEIAPGATLTVLPTQERRSGLGAVAAPAFQFILTVAGPMAINLVSSYLYDRLKGQKDLIEVEINRRTIEVDQGSITRIIEEEIKVKHL